jgi:predicted ArsR family transcriptional regulator
MKTTKLDERFFNSTRGHIVTMLRGTACTVEELARSLDLTDNAVRAHLATLERDGMVKQKGVRRGFRKPHYTYTLSHEAEALFPKAYDVLLNQLLFVLKARMPRKKMEEILREVGRSLATLQAPGGKREGIESRVKRAVQALAQIGGKATAEREGDEWFIRSEACPLAAAVSEHPEVCRLAEALVAQIIGTDVREQCDREGQPKCRFAITARDGD